MLAGVNVRVRLFAGLRERAGWSQREIDAATVADVWPALDLGAEPAGLLYAVLSKLGVLSSVNTLIGDVTAEPGTAAAPSHFFSGGKIMTFAALIAALNVVLLTALSTLAAFLYNLCAALTGGIEVTLSDQTNH